MLALAGGIALILTGGCLAKPTTYFDDGLVIDRDTTWQDGTWQVNGTFEIASGRLTLLNATLNLASSDGKPVWNVASGASLVATDSVINSQGGYVGGELRGDARFVSCQFTVFNRFHDMGAWITVLSDTFVLEKCTLDGWDLTILGDATIEDCVFTLFYRGIQLGDPKATDPPSYHVTVNRVNLTGDRRCMGPLVQGPGSDPSDCSVTVRNSEFNLVEGSITLSDFPAAGSVLFERCSIATSGLGFHMLDCGPAVVVRECIFEGGTGIKVFTATSGAPYMDGLRMDVTDCGLDILGSAALSVVLNSSIRSSFIGIRAEAGAVEVRDSHIDALTFDFRVFQGHVEVIGTTHGYDAECYGDSYVRENRTLAIDSVAWQDGPVIAQGLLGFVDPQGRTIGDTVAVGTASVNLTHWFVTATSVVWANETITVHEKDGVTFSSEAVDIRNLDSLDVRIVDDWAPVGLVETPLEGALLGTSSVSVTGTFDERGSGIDVVRMRIAGSGWVVADITPVSTFSATLSGLGEGDHTIELELLDLTGGRSLAFVNVTVDTLPPAIVVLSPGALTSEVPVILLGVTEPSSTVLVNEVEVPVSEVGEFSMDLGSDEGTILVDIVVTDAAGHVNSTTLTIVVDISPPELVVTSPLPGAWVTSTEVMVTGTVEPGAVVTVNGWEPVVSGNQFSISVPGSEGPLDLEIVAVDPAGNEARLSILVNIDTEAPNLFVNEPTDEHVSPVHEVVFSGTLYEENLLSLTVGGEAIAVLDGVWTTMIQLEEGMNQVEVVATDEAGHVRQVTRNVLVDSIAPVMTATLVIGDEEYDASVTTVRTRDTDAFLRVYLTEACTVTVTGLKPVQASEGSNRITLPFAENMAVTISVVASDEAGHSSDTATWTVTVDNLAPVIEVTEPQSGTVVEVSRVVVVGHTEPGSALSVDGVNVQVGDDGSFSITLDLEDGMNVFRLSAMDDLGNEATMDLEVSFSPPETQQDDEGGVPKWVLGTAVALAVAGAAVVLMLRRRR